MAHSAAQPHWNNLESRSSSSFTYGHRGRNHIRYWLPSILKHKYVALRFLPQSVYERAAPLQLEPTPDVVARIFMIFRGVGETELGLWEEACERKNIPVEFWKNVVGVDVEGMAETEAATEAER